MPENGVLSSVFCGQFLVGQCLVKENASQCLSLCLERSPRFSQSVFRGVSRCLHISRNHLLLYLSVTRSKKRKQINKTINFQFANFNKQKFVRPICSLRLSSDKRYQHANANKALRFVTLHSRDRTAEASGELQGQNQMLKLNGKTELQNRVKVNGEIAESNAATEW